MKAAELAKLPLGELSKLTPDVLAYVMTYLPLPEVSRLCQSHPVLNDFCTNPKHERYWKKMIEDTYASEPFYQNYISQYPNLSYNYVLYTELIKQLPTEVQNKIYSRLNQRSLSMDSLPPVLDSPILSTETPLPPMVLSEPRYDFIQEDAPLNNKEKKYCRCLLRVQDKSGGKGYFRTKGAPYGICTNSVGTQVRECSQYYDWGAMDLDMLIAWADLHAIPRDYDTSSRESVLSRINQYKAIKY